MDIAVDFDGTCVTHEYPIVGKNIGAEKVLKELIANGHNLILFTMRSKGELQEAIDWFSKHSIPLHGVGKNPTQHLWTESSKCYAQLYVDDAGIGMPLIIGKHERPYVNWRRVRNIFMKNGIIKAK